jgi:alpha-L-fucosidase
MDLYFRSVGRNGKLLLNVPPTRDGVLHPTDVTRLLHFAELRRDVFGRDFADARRIRWTRPTPTTASGVLDIGRPRSFGIIRLEEPIENGQTVARYSVHGAGADRVFRPLSRGTTIGYAKLDRVTAPDIRYVRIDIEEAVAEPEPLKIRIFD